MTAARDKADHHLAAVARPTLTGALSALAVLAMHGLFGLGIALSPPLRAPTGAGKPLVLLNELSAPVTRPAADAIAVNFTAAALAESVGPPRPSMPAMPASPDAEGVIVDAGQADATQVARICRAWPQQRGQRSDARPDLNVLVRVAEDGRVLDSRLLVGTGSTDRDAALQHCLLTLARLTPFRVEGHAVTAWQRLRPLDGPGVESSRRP